MSCCRAGPCEQLFKPRMARRSLEQYRKKGHGDLDRRLVAMASEGGLEGARVLEIGGGIGTIQAELVEAGAEQGEVVELVSAWEPYARELARDKALETRTSFRVADVLQSPGSVEAADVVVLNRVVCCSADGVQLAGAAARLTGRTLLLSFPHDTFWLRVGLRVVNAGMWVVRRSFRAFVHPRAALIGAATSQGLCLAETGREGFWEFAAFRRA
jgi:Methyltransferase domain